MSNFVQPPWSLPNVAYSVLVVAPTEEPLTLEQAKRRAGLDWPAGDPRDADMQDFIAAARQQVERDSELALLTQTRDVYLTTTPEYAGPFPLPPQCTPAQSVTETSPGVYRVVAGWPSPADLEREAPLLVQAVGLLVAHMATIGRDLAIVGTTVVAVMPEGYREAIDAHRLVWVA